MINFSTNSSSTCYSFFYSRSRSFRFVTDRKVGSETVGKRSGVEDAKWHSVRGTKAKPRKHSHDRQVRSRANREEGVVTSLKTRSVARFALLEPDPPSSRFRSAKYCPIISRKRCFNRVETRPANR